MYVIPGLHAFTEPKLRNIVLVVQIFFSNICELNFQSWNYVTAELHILHLRRYTMLILWDQVHAFKSRLPLFKTAISGKKKKGLTEENKYHTITEIIKNIVKDQFPE